MIFVTVPDESVGVGLVTTLVEEGLVACGNLLPGVRSIYAWEGKICDEQELLLILKTTESLCTNFKGAIDAESPSGIRLELTYDVNAFIRGIDAEETICLPAD